MKNFKVLLILLSLFVIPTVIYGQNKAQTTIEIICPESTEVTVTVTYVDFANGVTTVEKTNVMLAYSLSYNAHVIYFNFTVDSGAKMLYVTASTLSGRYGNQRFNQYVRNVTFDFR